MRTIKKTVGMSALRRKPPGLFGLCRILVFQRVSGVYDSYPLRQRRRAQVPALPTPQASHTGVLELCRCHNLPVGHHPG